jgi:mannan endo-1,4-beta-mannosidase
MTAGIGQNALLVAVKSSLGVGYTCAGLPPVARDPAARASYGERPGSFWFALRGGQGADNVTWLWTINQGGSGTGPAVDWWPGSAYVTWVGIDGYYYRPSDTFATVFGNTITQVRIFSDKPILLSETAVGPDAGQFAKINNLFDGMRRYKTLGLVWFDIAQSVGILHQNWRIEDSQAAAAAFRFGVSTLTLARPSQ